MRRTLTLAALALAVAACGSRDDNAPPPPEDRPIGSSAKPAPTRVAGGSMTDPAPVSAAGSARAIFKGRCSTCHGTTGRGDGIAAGAMRPPPRDYSDPAWQASVSDADLAKIIVAGGAAVGRSSMMPANPDLADKPDVVAELVTIIRGFAAK